VDAQRPLTFWIADVKKAEYFCIVRQSSERPDCWQVHETGSGPKAADALGGEGEV
jgi:hypothetical protein